MDTKFQKCQIFSKTEILWLLYPHDKSRLCYEIFFNRWLTSQRCQKGGKVCQINNIDQGEVTTTLHFLPTQIIPNPPTPTCIPNHTFPINLTLKESIGSTINSGTFVFQQKAPPPPAKTNHNIDQLSIQLNSTQLN